MSPPRKTPTRGRKLHDEEERLWRETMRDVVTLPKAACRKVGSPAFGNTPRQQKNLEVSRFLESALGSSRPMKAPPAPAPAREKAPTLAPRQSSTAPKPVVPVRAGLGSGIDGATARRLAQGRIVPDATLDLHGMTQDHAHAALERFLGISVVHGRRCVLIVTGKGGPSKPHDDSDALWARRKPGVLRSLVPLWLEHSAQRDRIANVRAAHVRHGGGGALYIYLRGK